MNINLYRFLRLIVASLFILTSCSTPLNSSPVTASDGSANATLSAQVGANATPIADVAAQQSNTQLCFSGELPLGFVNASTPSQQIPYCDVQTTEFKLMIGEQNTISRWVYALAAPFFTIDDDISSAILKKAWLSGSQSGLMVSNLMVSQNTFDVLSAFWGSPDTNFVLIKDSEEMKENTTQNETYWAILPFEDIEPTWKIITVDGQSPLHKDFDIQTYALDVPISLLNQNGSALDENDSAKTFVLPSSNRDPNKLTTVLMTGVTALVRATANTMEQRGMTYPADQIRPWFLEADIVHISNEIPFSEKCAQPYPRTDELVFCSQTEYIKLLESISTDVVELSGDHFQDYGPEATLYTIDLYNERGWKYYGGGINLADGQKAAKFEINGNKIAFIGCNGKGGGYAGATETNPGAVHCDFDFMEAQIKQLRKEGYLPIVTFQHLEYYSYNAHPILMKDFRRVADAGAVIVSGSQAHQPHAMEFYNGAFLHYGLGNLFFDQLFESKETGQAFIDRHVFYDGKYIGTELLTIQFVDLAQSRPMTLEERQLLLYTVFKASKNIDAVVK
jgi:hypothetical protein